MCLRYIMHAHCICFQDHARFVREIALLSSAREAGGEVINDLNFLDDLEKKEADAALDDGLHVFASASAGWKKGFLGGSGKPKKKVAPAASASDSGVAPVRPSQEQAAERAVTFSAETNDAREEEESEDKPTPSQKPMSRFKQSLGKNHLYNSDSDRSMPDARVSAHESEPAPTSSSGSSSKAIRPGATLIGAIKEIS